MTTPDKAAIGDGNQGLGASEDRPGSQASDQAAARLDAPRVDPSREWQPIATAPKDGEVVLICFANAGGQIAMAAWVAEPYSSEDPEDGHWRGFLAMLGVTDFIEPTHWMPLPAPPESGK